jgi:arsenite methyltransferase
LSASQYNGTGHMTSDSTRDDASIPKAYHLLDSKGNGASSPGPMDTDIARPEVCTANLNQPSTDSSFLCYLCHLPSRLRSLRGSTDKLPMGDASSRESTARLRSEVGKLYARVATNPHGSFHFNRGGNYAVKMLSYDRTEIDALPTASTDSFAGVGNPHIIDSLRTGEVVLDVGSGSGTDLLLAARKVGPSGRTIGVDFTQEMIARCRASILESGLERVEVKLGDAESLPVPDASVDAVLSNGVLNLIPNKELAFREIYRVLVPGGRLLLSDTVLSLNLGSVLGRSAALWALCVAGAIPEKKLIDLASRTGFQQVRITHRFNCIRGISRELIARWLGIKGVNLFAVKPVR